MLAVRMFLREQHCPGVLPWVAASAARDTIQIAIGPTFHLWGVFGIWIFSASLQGSNYSMVGRHAYLARIDVPDCGLPQSARHETALAKM